jgi:hypothetical protein
MQNPAAMMAAALVEIRKALRAAVPRSPIEVLEVITTPLKYSPLMQMPAVLVLPRKHLDTSAIRSIRRELDGV